MKKSHPEPRRTALFPLSGKCAAAAAKAWGSGVVLRHLWVEEASP